MSNFFDPKGFAAGGFLDQQVCDVEEIKATKFDYNGTVDPPANVIEIVWKRADGKTRTEVYGTGKASPTEDGNNVDQALGGQCKAAPFFDALFKTKFPSKTLGTEGLSALKGHRFVLKNIGKGGKDNFVPASYVGLAEGDAAEAQAKNDEVRDMVGTLVRTQVELAGGSLQKSKLPALIGKVLATSPDIKPQALSLVMSDSFLSTVPGVSFEKGVLALIQ